MILKTNNKSKKIKSNTILFCYYISTMLNISLMFYHVAFYMYFSKEFITCYCIDVFAWNTKQLFLLIELDKRCLIYKLFNNISFFLCFLNRNLVSIVAVFALFHIYGFFYRILWKIKLQSRNNE